MKGVWYTPVTTGHGHWCRGWNRARVQHRWEHWTKAKMVFSSSLLPSRRPKARVCSPTHALIFKLHGPCKTRMCIPEVSIVSKLKYYHLLKAFPAFPHHLFQISSFFLCTPLIGTLYLFWITWKWWNCGSEKWRNLLKVTQLVRLKIRTQNK